MKKIVSLLILLFAFASCTQDVTRNGNSIKALKDGVLWKPVVTTATMATDGKLTINALYQNQSLTINTSSAAAGVYAFGTGVTNKATFIYTQDGIDITYVTGTGVGSGNITISDYDVVNKTITGTFKFNANTEVVSPDVNPIVNFSQGGFFKLPVTSGI